MTDRVAILIDFENIGNIDHVKAVLRIAEERGFVVAKKAFGNWSDDSIEQGQTDLTKLGVELVHQVGIGKGRNGSDMKLVIDAMDLLHDAHRRIDVFVLATSDIDFVPLVVRLRSSGKVVISAGRPEVTSDLLRATVDQFFPLGHEARRQESGASSNSQGPPKPVNPAEQLKPSKKSPIADAPAGLDQATKLLILSAIFDLTSRGHQVIKGSPLHQSMKAIDPSFDFRDLGFETFADMLESHERLEVHGRGLQGDITVTIKDGPGATDPTP